MSKKFVIGTPNLILSDQNYRFDHDYVGDSFSSFQSLTNKDIELNQIFSDLDLRIKHETVDQLKRVKYADVILFSSEKLAEKLIAGLG